MSCFFFEAALQVADHQIHNGEDFLTAQRLVEDNLVEAVQELGTELLLEQRLHVAAGLLADFAVVADALQNGLRAEVRREDDDRVLEVDRAALAVSECGRRQAPAAGR